MPADTEFPIPVAIFTVNRHHAYDTSCEVSSWLLTAGLVLPEWRLIAVDPHRGQYCTSVISLPATPSCARPESKIVDVNVTSRGQMQLEALRQEIIAHPLLARPSLTSKLAVNRPSTSPPSPPPNPARPSFLRRAALYGSCGCDSLPVRSTRRSKTPVCLSRRPSQCVSSSQQPTANTAAYHLPPPIASHHRRHSITASSPRRISPR
jgi:hypothetical protein